MAEASSKKLDIRMSVGAVILDVTEINPDGPDKRFTYQVFKGHDAAYFDSPPELLQGIEEFWGSVPQKLSDFIRNGGK